MIFNEFHYFSEALRMQTSTYVLLPEPAAIEEHHNAPIPTLYLLHGLSDDHTNWLRNSRIEQYARKYYVAVVMPAVQRSFYTDMAYGAKYFTFVSQELPERMEQYFPLCKNREGRFAAGLSMGGYGALKLGLRCPERYAAVASLSGALGMQDAFKWSKGLPYELNEAVALFGDDAKVRASDDNLWNPATRLCKQPQKAPKMFMACGTEDSLLPVNNAFYDAFGEPLSIEYHTEAGDHNWDFWDRYIQRVLAWMPLEKVVNVW